MRPTPSRSHRSCGLRVYSVKDAATVDVAVEIPAFC